MTRDVTDEGIDELVKELRELKDVLRGISAKVIQIEARARRAFPSAHPRACLRSRSAAQKLTDAPTISDREALKLYDDLVVLARQGNRGEVQHRLESMALPNLFLLSRELGVSLGRRKPSRKVLVNGVLGRIGESIMLSTSSVRQGWERPEQGTDATTASLEQRDEVGKGRPG